MSFTANDYKNAAAKLVVPIAVVKAVADVESSGTTHWPGDGRVPILFEAAHFSRLTGGIYDQSNPDISSPVWNPALYRGGPAEYGRLAAAAKLNRVAALQSASWGAFQVMGFNYKPLGYATIDEFVDAMQTDAGQLDSFVRYVQHFGLAPALRALNWTAFAVGYNGTGAVAAYAAKMAVAYAHYAAGGGPRALRQGDQGDDVVALQQALGITPVDGDFGPATDRAVRMFQTSHHLGVDGIAGDATKAALHI